MTASTHRQIPTAIAFFLAAAASFLMAAGCDWYHHRCYGYASSYAPPVLFTDDFATGPKPEWNNARGAWTVTATSYASTAPAPVTGSATGACTFLTGVTLTPDVELYTQILAPEQAGIWLHADPAGARGVLLVIEATTFTSVPVVPVAYFLTVDPTAGLSTPQGAVVLTGYTGGTVDCTASATARGEYRAFLSYPGGSASTFHLESGFSGTVGLYDNGGAPQGFTIVRVTDGTSYPYFYDSYDCE
jgi:hypothetical protein